MKRTKVMYAEINVTIKIIIKLISIIIWLRYLKLDKKDIAIMGIPKYRLKIEDTLLSSPNILKTMIQLADLLNPGIKARHWNIPAKKNFNTLPSTLSLWNCFISEK